MIARPTFATLFVIFALLAVGRPVLAQPITTGVITSPTDIFNTGFDVVEAANLGGTGQATVNGITHANSNSTYGPVNFSGPFGDPNPATFSGDLFTLLDGIAGTNNANEPGTLSVPGLITGESYLFQSYWIVKDNFLTRKMDVVFEGESLAGIDANPNTNEAVLISYEFTAADTVFDATFEATGGDDNTWITGFSLQALGELPISVANGDFEIPDIGGNSQVQDIPNWFDSTGNFTAWYQGEDRIIDDPPTYENSQHAAFGPTGWIYQSIGEKATGDTQLDWSFTQGTFTDNNASTGFEVQFFAGDGVFTGADGVDIASAGLTQVGSTATFDSMNAAGLISRINQGTLDLQGVADGTELWLRIGATGPQAGTGFAPIDDISVRVLSTPIPEPTTGVLGVFALSLLALRRRLRG